MSAEGACVWKVSEGELTNPPMLSSLCSSNIDTEYVFISFKCNYYFECYVVDGHHFVIIIIIIIIIIFTCILLNQVFYTCDI